MGHWHKEEIQALRRVIDLGLTLIDTEELVGEVVRDFRDKAYIVSKVLLHP